MASLFDSSCTRICNTLLLQLDIHPVLVDVGYSGGSGEASGLILNDPLRLLRHTSHTRYDAVVCRVWQFLRHIKRGFADKPRPFLPQIVG